MNINNKNCDDFLSLFTKILDQNDTDALKYIINIALDFASKIIKDGDIYSIERIKQ